MSMETRKVLLSPPSQPSSQRSFWGTRLAPVSTYLDMGCCFPPPQPRSLTRTQKQRGAPVRTGEVLRPLWAGLEVGWEGLLAGGG